MANVIKHKGIVENINNSHIRVRITQASACASCSVKGHCGSADNKEKIVDVYDTQHTYSLGEEVMIYGTTSMGMQAVFIAFVVPFIILIAALFISLSVTDGDEPLSGLISLITLIPYYIIIYFLRNKIKKNFSFTVKPINN